MTEPKPPLNISQLDQRLTEVAAKMKIPVARARLMLCTMIVSQMLPESVAIKGGMGVKLRLGEGGTRATADLDVSTRVRGEEFEQSLREKLAAGWGAVPPSKGVLRGNPDAPNRTAFTATVRSGKMHDPGLTRPAYVMHPYRVSIEFLGSPWGGLDLEVADPEIDPKAHSLWKIDSELLQFGAAFGFGELRPVSLVDLEYQIAQKIHAVTDPDYSRVHDLVDLQLLWMDRPDVRLVTELCVRTFRWRNQQPWPPIPLRPMEHWELAYLDARKETEVDGETPVSPDVGAARAWLSGVIDELAGNAEQTNFGLT